MSIATIYAASPSGLILSTSATYANARAGAGLARTQWPTSGSALGQQLTGGTYNVWQTLLDFDTSGLPDAATIVEAYASFVASADSSTTNFTILAYLYDWGTTLDTSDFVAGANLSALTAFADYTIGGTISTSGYTNISRVADGATAGINKTGKTRLLLASANQRDNVAPTTNEFLGLNFSTANKIPRLDIAYVTNVAAWELAMAEQTMQDLDYPSAVTNVPWTEIGASAAMFPDKPRKGQLWPRGDW